MALPLSAPKRNRAEAVLLTGRRWLEAARPFAAPATAALIVLAAVFFRQLDVPKDRTIWAEDGVVFAQCLFDRSVLQCLGEPYAGYLHEVARLVAMVATAGDPAMMPFLFTLAAGIVAAWCAWTVAVTVRDVTASTVAGVFAGASLGLVFQAGREVLGNVTNLHWILLAAAVVVIVCSWLGRRPRPWDLALIAATALSSPLAPFLPILGFGAVVARTRDAWRHLLLVTLFAVPQTVVLMQATRELPQGWFGLRPAIAGFWDLVIAQGWFGGRGLPPDVVVPLALFGLTIGVVLLARLPLRHANGESDPGQSDTTSERPELSAGLGHRLIVLTALLCIGAAIFLVSVLLNRWIAPRYSYDAAALTSIAVAMAGGWVTREGRRRSLGSSGDQEAAAAQSPSSRDRAPIPAVARLALIARRSVLAVVLVISIGFGLSFRVESLASPGPDVVAAINAARGLCGPATPAVTIAVSPSNLRRMRMTIPCDRLTGGRTSWTRGTHKGA